MKRSRVCGCVSLPEAVNILAILGMVISLILSIAAGCLFPFPTILDCGVRNCEYETNHNRSLPMIYSLAVFLILVNIVWFTCSASLYEKNKIDGIKGVKKMIKTGCYIIGFIKSVNYAILLIFGLVYLINQEQWNMVGYISIPLGLSQLIFTYLILHGIRTESTGEIKAWIIFEVVVLVIYLFTNLMYLNSMGFVSSIIISMVVVIISYMYMSGLVTVLYNIILEDDTFNLQNKIKDSNTNLETKEKIKHDTSANIQGNPLEPILLVPGAPPLPQSPQVSMFRPPLPSPYYGGYQHPGYGPSPSLHQYDPPQRGGHIVHYTQHQPQHHQLPQYPTKEPQSQHTPLH